MIASNTRRLASIGLLAALLGLTPGLEHGSGAKAQEQVLTYTESTGRLALGYPVPIPVESLTPVDGFRSFASLQARHLDLAFSSNRIEAIIVGRSLEGRPIIAYRFGDRNKRTREGLREPAMLINGSIHAREWQSPEIVTEIFERLALNNKDNGLFEYLSDNATIIITPLSNPDGLLQTQRWPDQVVSAAGPSGPVNPRDGRQRRKNKLDVDDDLFSFDDYLFGVDLNRNFPVGHGGASPNPESIIYQGPGPASEPETQAVIAAGKLGPVNRLRSFVDYHSFTKLFFIPNTANDRRNALTQALAEKAQATLGSLGSDYAIVPLPVEDYIGVNDEFHAETYQIPSWTFETEPDGNGGLNYGGLGAANDGFMLPESEIARVRDEVAQQQTMLFYHQAGPPSLVAARVVDLRNGRTVYKARWKVRGNGKRRVLRVSVNKRLRANRPYRLWLAFDKPMRIRRAGAVVPFPGLVQPNLPLLALSGDGGSVSFDSLKWLNTRARAPYGYRRYEDDAIAADFTLPGSLAGKPLQLAVTVADFAQQQLDADPRTPVDWVDGAWSGYEDENGDLGDSGGTDSTLVIGGKARQTAQADDDDEDDEDEDD